MKTMVVNGEQMSRIRKHLYEKYPFLYRENIAYSASVVDAYELEYDVRFEEDIKEVL